MNWFEKILVALDAKMTRPTNYGWFHLLCIALVILVTILIAFLIKKNREKTTRIVLFTYAILSIVLEIYKQLNFSFNSSSGVWDYQWYAFPFQFCSTPMYVALVASLLKPCKFRDYLYSYLATFSLFAGLSVMIYPNDVFTSTIGINIQTMFVHGGQVVIALCIWMSHIIKIDWKTVLKGTAVFAVMVTVALLMDIIFVKANIVGTETFNMFYISPYFDCTLVILADIYKAVPYIVFLLIYLIGFMLAAYIVMYLVWGISFVSNWIVRKIKKDNNSNGTNNPTEQNN